MLPLRSACLRLSPNTPIWRQLSGRHGNRGLLKLLPRGRTGPDKRYRFDFPTLFPLGEQSVEIFNCAEKAIINRYARLPPEGASTRDVRPALLGVILRQRTMND